MRNYLLTLSIVVITWFGTGKPAQAINTEFLFEAESPYQTVYVTRQDSTVTLRNGSRFDRSSSMDTSEPYRHVLEYTGLMMLSLAYLDEPKNALVIGLGGGTVPKYLKKYYSEMDIVNVEMDPVVAKVAKKYFNFSESPSNKIVIMDGRRFLQRSDQKFDLIFLDAYYGSYIPFHLLTQEFLTLVKSRLSDAGVVVTNTWRSPQLYQRESATWSAVFGHFDNFLGQRSGNRVAIATKTGRHYSLEELTGRMRAIQNEKEFKEINLLDMAKSTRDLKPTWPVDASLLTDDYAPVNLLIDPRKVTAE